MMHGDSLLPEAVRSASPAALEASAAGLRKVDPYFTLDAWRGIAALWVVTLHSCLPYIQSGHRWFLRNPIYVTSIWGQLGVTMFFVISGYCIVGAAYNGIVTGKPLAFFCMDRLRRIYPPYFVALLGTLALSGATGWLARHDLLSGHHPLSLPSISSGWVWLSNFTLTQTPAGQYSLLVVAWSLCYEVAFYAIVVLFLGLGSFWKEAGAVSRLRVLLAGVSLLTVGSLTWLCASPRTCGFPLNLWYPFGLGALLFSCVAGKNSAAKTLGRSVTTGVRLATGIALLLTALYAAMHADQIDATQGNLGHPSTRIQALATLAFCILLYGLRRYDARLLRRKPVAFLAQFGSFSYSLYLVHTPLLPFVDAGIRQAGFTENWYLVTFASQIAVSMVAGWLFYVGIERRFISKRQKARIAVEENSESPDNHRNAAGLPDG